MLNVIHEAAACDVTFLSEYYKDGDTCSCCHCYYYCYYYSYLLSTGFWICHSCIWFFWNSCSSIACFGLCCSLLKDYELRPKYNKLLVCGLFDVNFQQKFMSMIINFAWWVVRMGRVYFKASCRTGDQNRAFIFYVYLCLLPPWQCWLRHNVCELSVSRIRSLIRTDIVTTIPHEWLEHSRWNLQRIFTSP